ncbi:MAG: hypothetical protein JSU86_08125, partial [Phycisphaerales bacterium]
MSSFSVEIASTTVDGTERAIPFVFPVHMVESRVIWGRQMRSGDHRCPTPVLAFALGWLAWS